MTEPSEGSKPTIDALHRAIDSGEFVLAEQLLEAMDPDRVEPASAGADEFLDSDPHHFVASPDANTLVTVSGPRGVRPPGVGDFGAKAPPGH